MASERDPAPPDAVKIAVDEYVRWRLEQMIARKGQPKRPGMKGARAVAKDIRIPHPTPHNILIGRQGVGPKVERQWADRFFDGSVDQLRAEAMRWYRSEGAERVQRRTAEPPFPRMRAAIDMARDEGYEEAFLREYASRAHPSGASRSAAAWWTNIQAAYQEWRFASDYGKPSDRAEMRRGIDEGHVAPPAPRAKRLKKK